MYLSCNHMILRTNQEEKKNSVLFIHGPNKVFSGTQLIKSNGKKTQQYKSPHDRGNT